MVNTVSERVGRHNIRYSNGDGYTREQLIKERLEIEQIWEEFILEKQKMDSILDSKHLR